MSTQIQRRVALVTGAAGFIGFHISRKLLNEGWRVVGLDCMSDYYDVALKQQRENMLLGKQNYHSIHEKIEAPNVLRDVFDQEKPSVVIHLAAQAGVRYSISNPRAYLESNIVGTFELLEASRKFPPKHMLMASTSSVYGANESMPYREKDKADHQISFYAATKKSNENMAHSYAHLFNLPITMFRFFTVYGPWGRPDMAPMKFAKLILNSEPIDVYNEGQMWRDFTYVDDLTECIFRLIFKSPEGIKRSEKNDISTDTISGVAPYRVVNIGNSRSIKLMDFIAAFEKALNLKAHKNFLPLQPGDVSATWADVTVLKNLIGFVPNTNLESGVVKFINWYREYYQSELSKGIN